MPEHLKALVVILTIAAITFAFLRKPACVLGGCPDFLRKRNLWFGITLVAFLAHNFWLYALIAGILLIHASSRETNKVALFFSMLMVIPAVDADIPGFGLINYFFSLNHVRLLELVILLPAFFKLLHRNDSLPFGRLLPDKIVAAYLVLLLILALREATATDFMRQGFYLFIDIFVPYFVISRSLRTVQDFRDAMLAFVAAATVVAAISVFEAARHWHLYRGLSSALGIPFDTLSFVERSGALRAMGPTGHPIALGYVMAIALGFYLYLKQDIASNMARRLGMILLIAGLVAPLSRGPWVGAAVLLTVFVATGKNAVKRLAILAISAFMVLTVLSVLPGGNKIIDLLPFIGTVEKGNIDYRAQMLESSQAVIMRNPLFGSTDFALAPEMQAMKQGQGIIDIVNSYLLLALRIGLVGLGLFVLIFLSGIWGIYTTMRRLPDKKSEAYLLGQSLLASLVAVMVIIFTVSPISLIPIIYWSLAAMAVAYTRMVRLQTQPARVTEGLNR